MPRRHLKKDDRNTLCGLTITPKFQKQFAPDRQSVTCGACELASRPKTVAPPKVEVEAFVAAAVAPEAVAVAPAAAPAPEAAPSA